MWPREENTGWDICQSRNASSAKTYGYVEKFGKTSVVQGLAHKSEEQMGKGNLLAVSARTVELSLLFRMKYCLGCLSNAYQIFAKSKKSYVDLDLG